MATTSGPLPAGAVPASEWLAGLATRRAVARGEVVFRAGAAARHVYYVEAGRVLLLRHGPAGEDVVIHSAHAGECFAEASLHGERYHCTATAALPGFVLHIPAPALRDRLLADPEVAMQWVALLSRQLRRTRARVERLSLKGATARVRHLIVTEGQGARPAYHLRGTLRELAGELGLTHESLYRTLAALERDGVLQRHGDALVLLR